MSMLCVTVAAPTMAELRRRRDAVPEADLVELRLDSVADPDVAAALAGRSRPVIVTCRPVWEGGAFAGSEDERRALLKSALALGAEYVDIEWRAGFDDILADTKGQRIVLSSHAFDAVPVDLVDRTRAMCGTGAEFVKVAIPASRLRDCVTLLELTRTIGAAHRLLVIAMGERGIATRVLASRFGCPWTYAGDVAAVGQLLPKTLLGEFGFRTIGEATSVYGLVGDPIGHSLSPAMHNAAFRAVGLDCVYLPLAAADADDFLDFARALDVQGASVTIPFKVPLYERAAIVDHRARRIGAINTLRRASGGWEATNTDLEGFLRPLHDRGVRLAGKRASVLGAGGAARAVAVALAESGARVLVHARNTAKAEQVAAVAGGAVGPWPLEPGSWDLLVNCTPVGTRPRTDMPVSTSALTGEIVYDLVYNPTATPLLRAAATAGCTAIGGLEMLVAQAHEQFAWWTHSLPPAGVMHAAAERRLTEFTSDDHHVI
jgi:3-dehydroquinate dehydratase/shikimate dehydrogenase